MKAIDYILLLAVAALVGLAVYFLRKGRSCCGGGRDCGGQCACCKKNKGEDKT